MRTQFAPLLILALLASAGSAAAQTWTAAPSMGTARAGAAGVVLDGRLYVLGGENAAGTPLRTAEVFDPASGWSPISDLRDARVDAAATVLDGQIVLAGGRGSDGKPTGKVEVYDPAEDDWDSFDDLQEEREGLGAAVVDGQLYAFGGAGEGGALLPSMEAYEGSWGNYEDWTLSPPRARFGAVTEGGALILAGGYSTFGPLDRVDRYVPYQSETPSLAPLRTARGGLGLAGKAGVVFAVGGRDASDRVLSDVEALVLAVGTWTALAPLPQPREGAVAAVVGDDLYVVGGMDGFGSVLASTVRLDGVAVADEDGPEAGAPGLRLVGANPVRSLTAFEVGVGQPGRVRLTVVDALGREVAVLLDVDLPTGPRRVEWRADVAPGVYVARLDGPGGRASAVLTVVR